MDGNITIAEITQQHAPILLRTADLIDCLRVCTQVAATPQAARITLPNVGGNSSLFATALSTVANEGLDVLGDASTYFLDIQLTARSMGSTIQRLQQSFGKPEERVTHERLLKRVVEEIESCTKGSQNLESQLSAWRKQVANFQTAVQRAQAQLGNDAENMEDEIGTLDDGVVNENKQLERILVKEEEARRAYEDAKRKKASLQYDIALPRQLSTLELAYQVGRFSWCWFWSRNTSQDLKAAQEEVERRRQAAEAYEVRIAEAQVQLSKMNDKVFELEKYKRGLADTLQAVCILSDNIRNLVVEFARMGPYVKQLTKRSADTGAMSNDYANEAAPVSEIKLFVSDMHEMGQFALTVEHMAWVYGTLIERVLIGGINDCNAKSTDDDFGGRLSTMKLGDDRPQNDSVCSLLLTDVDASYSQKEKALQLSHGRILAAMDKAAQPKRRSKFSFRR